MYVKKKETFSMDKKDQRRRQKELLKKRRANLPNRILPISCSDKNFQERWYRGRSILNFPHSFSMVLAGPPSSGKSTLIKNVLLRAEPPFEKVLIVHFDKEGSSEWEDIGDSNDGVELTDEIPDPKLINKDKKKMALILEDMNLGTLSKKQKENLDRLAGYSRSHRGVSIFCNAQNPFDVPVGFRRMANIFVLWRQPDLMALSAMASKTGYKPDDFRKLFSFCKKQHDSIMIDLTNNSPYPLRFNGFTPINRNGAENTVDELPEKTKSDEEQSTSSDEDSDTDIEMFNDL